MQFLILFSFLHKTSKKWTWNVVSESSTNQTLKIFDGQKLLTHERILKLCESYQRYFCRFVCFVLALLFFFVIQNWFLLLSSSHQHFEKLVFLSNSLALNAKPKNLSRWGKMLIKWEYNWIEFVSFVALKGEGDGN